MGKKEANENRATKLCCIKKYFIVNKEHTFQSYYVIFFHRHKQKIVIFRSVAIQSLAIVRFIPPNSR